MGEQRLRKIGEVKATLFKKQFDEIYDFWKQKAIDDYAYRGELKFIKEHNKIFIYLIFEIEDNLEQIDPNDFE